MYIRKSIAPAKRGQMDLLTVNNPKENQGARRPSGIFLTEPGEIGRTHRKTISQVHQASHKSIRPPTERAGMTQEKVTFILHNPSKTIEENKSFNLVKCRQKLRDLTDDRDRSLLQKQERRQKQLEKYYKEQQNEKKKRIALQLEKDDHRRIILASYKNKLREMEDKSADDYKSHINELSKRDLKAQNSYYKKQTNLSAYIHYYTQDFRNDDSEVQKSLEKIENKLHSAERRSSERKEAISNHARKLSGKVPLIQQKYNELQDHKEEQKQIEFIK